MTDYSTAKVARQAVLDCATWVARISNSIPTREWYTELLRGLLYLQGTTGAAITRVEREVGSFQEDWVEYMGKMGEECIRNASTRSDREVSYLNYLIALVIRTCNTFESVNPIFSLNALERTSVQSIIFEMHRIALPEGVSDEPEDWVKGEIKKNYVKLMAHVIGCIFNSVKIAIKCDTDAHSHSSLSLSLRIIKKHIINVRYGLPGSYDEPSIMEILTDDKKLKEAATALDAEANTELTSP